jgi:hypothetical protein
MTAPQSEPRSYHGQPILKEPTWTWEIPCYLFTGGLAGASAGLACLAELRGNDTLARRAWAAALIGVAVSPGFLISDLGRPMRFLNMLRVFKVSSPMSVGSWILSGSGTLTAIATANAWLGVFPRLARAARPGAALLGLPLSTYTGALLSNTAIPVWHEARRMLPFVFATGAGLSAGAAAVLVTPVDDAAAARRLALAGAVAEIGTMRLMQQRLGDLAQPYKQGSASRFERAARGCLVAGAGLLAARGGRSRVAAGSAAGLLLAGALGARFSVYKAGFGSAADPKYVVGPQRERVQRGERPGASRSTARSR